MRRLTVTEWEKARDGLLKELSYCAPGRIFSRDEILDILRKRFPCWVEGPPQDDPSPEAWAAAYDSAMIYLSKITGYSSYAREALMILRDLDPRTIVKTKLPRPDFGQDF